MQIRIIATGAEGDHRQLFPQISFSEAGISAELMAELGVEEVITIPYTQPLEEIEEQRIAQLWQAAHNYEYNEISGSAVGMLTLGVMRSKPKCLAVQAWIKSIWTEYYTRKASTSANYDYSVCGVCPYSVPELMAELGL